MALRTITRTWSVDGVLTDVTSATLADATGTYGVKRNDTGATVVAATTAMTHASVGRYQYTFAEPVEGITYTASVRFVYAGNVYYFEHNLPATVPANSLKITYDDLRREIGRFLGYGRDPTVWSLDANKAADVEDCLKSGLRRFYYPPALPGEKYPWEWSFLTPVAQMTVYAPYAHGTVQINAGIVALTPDDDPDVDEFPSWAADGTLVVEGADYSVKTRDGALQLTLDDATATYVDSLGALRDLPYTLYHLSSYDLPADFAGFVGPMTLAPGQLVLYKPLDQVSEYDIRARLSEMFWAGTPQYFAARPKTPSYLTGSRWEVVFFPTPDDNYTIDYRYRIEPLSMDSSNIYPLGGHFHGETILESCLAAAEKTLNDTEAVHAKRFIECLVASVGQDRKLSAPASLDGPRMRAYHDCYQVVEYWRRSGTTYPT